MRIVKYMTLLIAILWVPLTVGAQHGNLKGTVSGGGEKLPGVTVYYEKNKTGTVTDMDGIFLLTDLDTGKQEIKITYTGYDSLIIPVHIVANQMVDLGNVSLVKKGTILSEVKIVGAHRQGSEAKAISMTKASDKIITVVSSESIGKMPDKNAADVLQRVAGTAVEKTKGEGHFVSLRGTPTDWTAILVNGNRLPTANEIEASRVFDFQVLPSSLIDYVVVTKTVTPDMEGDNIGGAINFLTHSSVTKKTFSINVAGGYSVLANKPSAELNFLWGNITKNKKFSYVIDGSYYSRAYAADAPVLAYGTNFNHSLARYELKKYTGERYTTGVNAAAEYKPSERLTIGTKFMLGRLIDEKWQQKTMYNWSDGSGARIRLQNIHGILDNQLYGGEVNMEWKPAEKWKIDGKIASYYNKFQYGPFPYSGNDPRNGYTTVEFISPLLEYTDKINTNFFGGKYDPNNTKDPNPYPYKLLDIDNPYGTGGDHYNNIQPKYQQLGQPGVGVTAADYYLSGAFADQNTTWERDPVVAQLNGSYKLNENITISAGGKYRMKEGERRLSYYEWRLVPGVGKIPLTQFQTMNMDPNNNYLKEWGAPYSGTFMPFFTRDQLSGFMSQYKDSLSGKAMDTANNNFQDWVGAHYKYRENVAAGYIMANAKITDRLSLIGGLRIEQTTLHETSDTLVVNNNASIGVSAKEQVLNRQYTAILPALNALYKAGENDNIRAAISRTFHRPNFEETKPGSPIWQRENFIRIFGNPNLKPTYSLNVDLVYEHYWGSKGMFSLGGYYKNVTDHIFVSSQADETPFNDGVMNKTFLNAENSFVAGFEMMVDRKFDFLPGILGGLGINANLTCSYSEMQVPGRPKKQAMTEQSPLLYNIALFYERKKVTTRLALNYKGAYTTDINLAANPDPAAKGKPLHLDTDYDIFMGSLYSLDFQAAYKINSRLSVYIELNNLLDAPYRTYIGVPERPIRTEYYRQKGMVGAKFEL